MKPWLRFFLGAALGALIASAAFAQQQPVITTSITQVTVAGAGPVAFLNLTNVGANYSSPPTITISAPPGPGVTATATASIDITGVVSNITITNSGSGYTQPPTVTFSAPTNVPAGQLGVTATATAFVGIPFAAPFQNESYGAAGTTIGITAVSVGTFPVGGYTDEFFVDGVSIGVSVVHPSSGQPATISWAPPRPGSYFLTVVSSDGLGHTATSLPVRYFAVGTAITSPTPNSIVPQGSSIAIQATATPQPLTGSSNNNAFVSKMEFYVDGTLIGTDSTAPYSIIHTPSNTPATHTIEARAFDNNGNQVSVNGTAVQNITMVPPIGTPPTSVISSPANNAVLPIPGADISIAVSAGSGTGLITKVELYIDGALFGTGTTFPYAFTWHPTVVGDYRLVALTYDDKSNVVASTLTKVTVAASPTVTLVSPVAGTTVGAGSATTVTAAATDSNVINGGIASVQFFASGVLIGSATTPSSGNNYSISWTPSTVGAANLTALAINNLGLSNQSPAVGVVVSSGGGGNPGGGTPPTISIVSPENGAALPVNTTQTVMATATAATGTVTSVQFLVNGVSIGTSTAFPYSVTWTPVTPGSYALTAVATDNAGGLTTSAANNVIVVANGAPTVAITAPTAGGSVGVNALQTITAAAASSTGFIARVQFFVNGVSVGTDDTYPYSTTWTPTSIGTYTLKARATDNTGNITDSVAIAVTVSGSAPPTVSVTSPASGSAYTVGTAVNLAATAADSDGTITQVQFLVNGVAIGSPDTISPYSALWTPGSAGTYTVTAQATDNSGNVTTSVAATVTIGSNAPPTVSLSSPSAGLSYALGNQVLVAAAANDSDGKVTSVQFLANGIAIGSATAAPFNVSWRPPAAGNYSLTAVATDDVSNITTSSAVSVTITAAAAPSTVIINPVSTQTYGVGNSIPFTAATTGGNGPIAQVQFFVNGAPLLTDTTSPYTATWTPVASGSYSLLAVATDSAGISSNSSALSVTIIGNAAPTVSLTSPATSTSISAGTPVIFSATAADVDGTVASVSFLVNGNTVGSASTAPFNVTWTPTAAGVYAVVAQAVDNSGNVTNSSATSITVLANQSPAVSFAAPTNGTVVRAGSATTLVASASDPDGTIASVQFFANGVSVGPPVTTLTSGGYRAQWSPAAEGIYTVTATAVDNSGAAKSTTLTVLATNATSGDTVYTGTFFGLGETGKFSVVNAGGKTAAFIGYSTAGAGKIYFYPGITVDASRGFTLTDSTGKVLVAGRTDDTAAIITTLDGAPVTLIGLVTFSPGTSVASGYYTGSLSGRASSQLAAIVGADGSIMLYASDGSVKTAGAGVVDSTGAFQNIAAIGGGVFSGKADPLTNFLSGSLTGPLAGGMMAAVESGVSFSDGFLRNLSSRGQVGTGTNVLVAGFVVGGTTAKQVLVRAIGPSLTQFGITGALADPQLQLFGGAGGTTLVTSNDNWGGASSLATASSSVGAFPLSASSLDSVVLATLSPGNYTAQVSGVNGSTGTALVEIYDVDNPTPYSAQKVINISTRAVVGTSQNRLIAGFVISGNTAKKVLVRAVGPTLGAAPFNVPGVLADPVLRIIRMSDNLVVRENDNWETGNDATLISNAATKSGAFPLAAGSKDAVILINLPPGTYSADVTGNGGTTGIAIVEVYEVP